MRFSWGVNVLDKEDVGIDGYVYLLVAKIYIHSTHYTLASTRTVIEAERQTHHQSRAEGGPFLPLGLGESA